MGDKTIVVFKDGTVSEEKVVIERDDTVTWVPDIGPNDITISFRELQPVPFKKGPLGWPDSKHTNKAKKPNGAIRRNILDDTHFHYTAIGYALAGENENRGQSPELIVDGGPTISDEDEAPKTATKRTASKGARKSAAKKGRTSHVKKSTRHAARRKTKGGARKKR